MRLSGPPGAGKSTVLADTAAGWIAAGAAPNRVVMVARSRNGLANLGRLVDDRIGDPQAPPRMLTHEGLAHWVIDQVEGRPPVVQLRGVGEWLAMRAAVERSAVHLERLRPVATEPACIEDLLEITGCFTQAMVGPGLLAERLRREPGLLPEIALVAANYESVLAGMGAVDTRDLAHRAVALLQEDPLALRGWADLLLIDEAEELSPAQWQLLEQLRLRLEPPGAAILAGAVSVSVPGFRGPSSRPFEQLMGLVPGAEEVELQVAPGAVHRLAAGWGLNMAPASSSRARSGNPAPPPDVEVWRAEDETDEAFAVAREIRRAHLAGELEYDQVAVLVRTPGTQLGAVVQAFATIGVPARVELARWADGMAVAQILAWLRALAVPDDDATLLRALDAGPIAPSPDEILALRRVAARDQCSLGAALRRWAASGPDDGLGPSAQLWQRLGGGAPDFGFRRLTFEELKSVLGGLELGLGLWELALREPEVAAGLARLHLALEDAASVTGALHLPVPDLTDWIDLVQLAMRRSGWEVELPPVPGLPEVTILSIAQAKGRSWPHVFLLGASEGTLPAASRRPRLLTPQEEQRLVELVPELEEVIGAPDPDRERRLFVLATTRAVRRLVVCWASRYRGVVTEAAPFAQALVAAGCRERPAPRADPVTRADLMAAQAAAHFRGEEGHPALKEAVELAELLRPWDPVAPGPDPLGETRLSATAMARWLACPRLYHYHRLRLGEMETSPQALGTAAHQLLERLYRQDGITSDPAHFLAAGDRLLRAELLPQLRWALVDPLEVLAAELALQGILRRWADRVVGRGPDAGYPVGTEIRFEVARTGYRLIGRIDSVWRRADGQVEVVDFKTTRSDPPGRILLRRAVVGDAAGPPSDWQLPIYLLAARQLDLGVDLPKPTAVRNWYLAQDPPPRVEGLLARGLLVQPAAGRSSDLLYEPELQQQFEELLEREAAALMLGRYPALPRHSHGTCLSNLGCPFGDCCDGAGSVGRETP